MSRVRITQIGQFKVNQVYWIAVTKDTETNTTVSAYEELPLV